jgi:NADH-quinone oxidoreductase subunit G
MKSVDVTIDGQIYVAKEGTLLIDLLIKHDLKVPYLCYHEALGADGNCRMCMVEIEGQKRPQIACDTLIKEGMNIHTKGEMIDSVHLDVLELELINHPVDCPVCDQAGECKLQDYYMEYGLHDSYISKDEKVKHQKHIDLGSNVILDQERCVLCARCTRFTSDITKTHELGIIGRGDHARVSTMPNRKLSNPYAMNVIDLCPVGAMTSGDFRFKQRVWFLTSTPSICQGCARGCSIYIDHNRPKNQDEKIYRFRPRRCDDVNGHFICDEGRLSYKGLQEGRLRVAYLKEQESDIDRAIESYREIVDSSKGSTILLLADANLYLEELERIVEYAQSIGASVATPIKSYIDEEFGDEWLRSSMRASNAKAIEKLGISTELPKGDISLLISFNHPDADRIRADRVISLQTHLDIVDRYDVTLPLATYVESSGTLINIDGIEQYSSKVITPNDPIPTVVEWIDRVEGGAI